MREYQRYVNCQLIFTTPCITGIEEKRNLHSKFLRNVVTFLLYITALHLRSMHFIDSTSSQEVSNLQSYLRTDTSEVCISQTVHIHKNFQTYNHIFLQIPQKYGFLRQNIFTRSFKPTIISSYRHLRSTYFIDSTSSHEVSNL